MKWYVSTYFSNGWFHTFLLIMNSYGCGWRSYVAIFRFKSKEIQGVSCWPWIQKRDYLLLDLILYSTVSFKTFHLFSLSQSHCYVFHMLRLVIHTSYKLHSVVLYLFHQFASVTFLCISRVPLIKKKFNGRKSYVNVT